MTIDEGRLKKIFQSVLCLEDPIDFDNLEFSKTPGWDSIAHLQLIAALENEFGIMIETLDVLAMSSYKKALTIVSKYVSTS